MAIGVGLFRDLASRVKLDGAGTGVQDVPTSVLDRGADHCLLVRGDIVKVDDPAGVGLAGDAAVSVVRVLVPPLAEVRSREIVPVRAVGVFVGGGPGRAGVGGEVSDGVVGVGDRAALVVHEVGEPARLTVVMKEHPGVRVRARSVLFLDP